MDIGVVALVVVYVIWACFMILREQKLKWQARSKALRYEIALKIIWSRSSEPEIQAIAEKAIEEDRSD